MKRNWFVKKEEYVWQFVPEHDMYCWVIVLNEMVTPMRETQEEADKDFAELGFAIKPNAMYPRHFSLPKESLVSYRKKSAEKRYAI